MSTKNAETAAQQPKNKRRYERYADAGLDVEGKGRKQKVGVNDENRGYSDSDGPKEKAERAEVARQAVTKGMHGGDRTDEEIAAEKRRRQLEGNSHTESPLLTRDSRRPISRD